MSKIIVTGGAGFIGSHLVDGLINLGHDVIVIDDFSTGRRENLIKSKKKIVVLEEKLSVEMPSLKKPPKILNGALYFYHLAALPRIERSIADPIGTHNVNVSGTLAALELAKKLKVKRFIFSSSSSVYGEQKKLPLKESLPPNPQNPYAFQKLMGEYYCRIYSNIHNLPVVVFRLFNVYGPRMFSKGSYKLVFTKWLEQIQNNLPLTIFGSGKQTRDFTFVSDVIDGLIGGMILSKKESFQVINLGYGKQVPVKYLAGLFNQPVQFLPERGFEERFKQADIKKAAKILGWKPKVSIEEGVKDLLEDFSTTHLKNH